VNKNSLITEIMETPFHLSSINKNEGSGITFFVKKMVILVKENDLIASEKKANNIDLDWLRIPWCFHCIIACLQLN
jgi:hypothetical protein